MKNHNMDDLKGRYIRHSYCKISNFESKLQKARQFRGLKVIFFFFQKFGNNFILITPTTRVYKYKHLQLL